MDSRPKMMNISVKSFISALLILAILLVLTYVLTFFVPAGSYERQLVDGQEIIVPDTYTRSGGGISLGRFLLSPILVLFTDGSLTTIVIIIFLLIIGGAFNALDEAGVMRYLLGRIHNGFAGRRYLFLSVASLFFMGLGSLCGSFEEIVPMVPLAVALAYSLGWDALVGMGYSILATGCGFACGVCNPFTVGVAQELMGLPMFSDVLFRLLSFVLIYGLLQLFLRRYAKRIEADPTRSPVYDPEKRAYWNSLQESFAVDKRMDRASLDFAAILGFGILLILCSAFVSVLSDYIMPIIALVFLIAGMVSVIMSGFGWGRYGKSFCTGAVNILPAILLILLASAVRFTLTEAGILDTLLYAVVSRTEGLGVGTVALLIYLLVLVMNFFIASGSAKAFLLIPLLAPLAELTGVPAPVVILAFCFGDGFSNVFYPTNPVLLLSTGVAGVSYGKWAKWSLPFQLLTLLITGVLVLLRCVIG